MNIIHSKYCKTHNKRKESTLSCFNCNIIYHFNCLSVKQKSNKINENWICEKCLPISKTNCLMCKKLVHVPKLKCLTCKKFSHIKCSDLSKFNPQNNWLCNICLDNELPFSGIDSTVFNLMIQGKEKLHDQIKALPSFKINTLLDKFPGEIKIQTDEMNLGTINSKYYTPTEFLSANFDKDNFSVFHVNVVSLQKNIDDLKTLLCALGHEFDIIAVTETKIQEHKSISLNIDIDGYNFENTPTGTLCGGAGIYI